MVNWPVSEDQPRKVNRHAYVLRTSWLNAGGTRRQSTTIKPDAEVATMSDDITVLPEPGDEVKGTAGFAYASIGCSVAAAFFVWVTYITDYVPLFTVVGLLSLLGLFTGIAHARRADRLQAITDLASILSGLLALISIAILVVLAMWDSNL